MSLPAAITAQTSPARLKVFEAELSAMPRSRAASLTSRNGTWVVARQRQRRVDLVGEDPRVVAGGGLGERLELLARRHAAGRVVRAAEQQHAHAVGEGGLDRVDVELAAAGHRHLADPAAASLTRMKNGW